MAIAGGIDTDTCNGNSGDGDGDDDGGIDTATGCETITGVP